MNEKIEVLRTAYDYINKLESAIERIVVNLDANRINEALLLIGEFAEGVQWLIQAITLTKDIQKSDISVEELNVKLNEVVEALENQDYILIMDIFNYEIKFFLNELKGKLEG